MFKKRPCVSLLGKDFAQELVVGLMRLFRVHRPNGSARMSHGGGMVDGCNGQGTGKFRPEHSAGGWVPSGALKLFPELPSVFRPRWRAGPVSPTPKAPESYRTHHSVHLILSRDTTP